MAPPTSPLITCPVCRARVVVSGAEEVVIHNAIIKVDTPTGRVTAKCPRCKSWMEVPLRYIG
jgi:transcription elongation factor Elf1